MKSKNQILKSLGMLFVLVASTMGAMAQRPYPYDTPTQTVCINGVPEPYGVTITPLSTYVWTVDGATVSPNWNLSATNTNLAAITWATAGTYRVQVLETTGAGCTQPLPVEVVVTVSPLATVDAGADQPVCALTPNVTLAGIIGGAISAKWSGGTGSFAPNATTLNAVYTPSAAEITVGTVTLILTTNDLAGLCGAVSDQMIITINPLATVDAGADQHVCDITPNVTLAGIIGGTISATWSGGAGSFAPNATTLNAVYTPSAAEITAGAVTLTLTNNDPAGPCDAVTDQMTITINQNPIVVAINTGPLCVGSILNLSATPSAGVGPYTYSWSGPGSYSSTEQNPTISNVSTTQAGVYTVTITGATLCTGAESTTVVVNPIPITSVIYHN